MEEQISEIEAPVTGNNEDDTQRDNDGNTHDKANIGHSKVKENRVTNVGHKPCVL